MSLPRCFCWTRFGTEAGEQVSQILARKEAERLANDGIFLWGIGNAVWPSMRQLLSIEPHPQAIFSPIRSTARKEDVVPEEVVRWTSAQTPEGNSYKIPDGSIVTSRAKRPGRRNRHYALVCVSSVALRLDLEAEKFAFSGLCNLMTGRPVGASQVTAIVRNTNSSLMRHPPFYAAALRVALSPPYFIELADPVVARNELSLIASDFPLAHQLGWR